MKWQRPHVSTLFFPLLWTHFFHLQHAQRLCSCCEPSQTTVAAPPAKGSSFSRECRVLQATWSEFSGLGIGV